MAVILFYKVMLMTFKNCCFSLFGTFWWQQNIGKTNISKMWKSKFLHYTIVLHILACNLKVVFADFTIVLWYTVVYFLLSSLIPIWNASHWSCDLLYHRSLPIGLTFLLCLGSQLYLPMHPCLPTFLTPAGYIPIHYLDYFLLEWVQCIMT